MPNLQDRIRRTRAWRHDLRRRRSRFVTLDLAGHRFAFADITDPAHAFFVREVYLGRWERRVLDAYSDAIRPGDTVLDIGAYVGPYSLLGAVRVGTHGRVFAFEPDPVARGLLEANLTRNGVRNVKVSADAVAATTGSLTLAGRLGSSTARAIPQAGSGVRVRTTGLDEFCAQQAVSPAVIKIDVEGGESEIVSPAGEQTLRDARTVIVEMHPHLGVDAVRIDHLFVGWGKHRAVLDSQGRGAYHVVYST